MAFKKIVKSILHMLLSRKAYEYLLKNYRDLNNILKLISYGIKYQFKKNIVDRDVKDIKQPLILVSQIQRSGGTLVSQLFDGNQNFFSYPSELVLTSPKWDWSKKKNFICYKSFEIRNYAEMGSYIKQSVAKNELQNDFLFDLLKQRRIFEKIQKKSMRDYFDAYFTSFFNSFENFKNINSDAKFIVAFTPRAIMYEKTRNDFFSIYPDGYLLSIIRDPISWLASATRHSQEYEKDYDKALKLWCTSTEASINAMANNSKIITIIFEELLQNTENVIRTICERIEVSYDASLLKPTFNGGTILSDSSFKAKEGIDKTATDRRNLIDTSSINPHLLNNAKTLYEKAKNISITISK